MVEGEVKQAIDYLENRMTSELENTMGPIVISKYFEQLSSKTENIMEWIGEIKSYETMRYGKKCDRVSFLFNKSPREMKYFLELTI